MIHSRNIKKPKVNFPSVEGIGGPSILGRIMLKNIYQPWRGENFVEITQNAINNPFNLRVGLPQMDKQLKDDRIFLFTKYLSYNPLTKQIEKRELIPLRNVEKVYIGQSPEEHHFTDYRLFVDGYPLARNPHVLALLVQLVDELPNLPQRIGLLLLTRTVPVV